MVFLKSLKKIAEQRPALFFVFEVVSIIAGITISFAIENWREEQQDKQIYKSILEEIVLDLKMDSANFQKGIQYRLHESELLLGYLQGHELDSFQLRNWFHVVTGRRLEIKQQSGGYIHWQNAPGITFNSGELSLLISGYYNEFYKGLEEVYNQEIEFYNRAQDYLLTNPTSVLASFTEADDSRFPKDFFNQLFTEEVKKEYEALSTSKYMRYLTEVKLFIIVNERLKYRKGLDLSTQLMAEINQEIRKL